jgi:hypothetical protein
MSTRCWLASGLFAWTVVGLVGCGGKAPAAATEKAVYAGMVPDDAFAAVVLYPKRVLASESLAKLDVKSMADDLTKQAGVSPLDVEQMAVLVASSNGSYAEKVAIFGRFSEPQDGAKLAAGWLKPWRAEAGWKPEEFEVAGHKCFRTTRDPDPSHRPGVCFLDERTFVMASEAWLPDIFAAKDAKSTLISTLAASDSVADATIVFSSTDAAKKVISQEFPAKMLPGPLKPIGDLPELLQAATLSIRTNPEISLKLTLLGKDEDSTGKLVATIKSFQQMGQSFLPALQAPPDEDIPAAERTMREYAAGLAAKLINGLVPHQSGNQVTVEIGDLGTLDSLVGNVVMPAVAAARGAAQHVQGMNNLRQLGMAMHASYQTIGTFPAHAIYSTDGKPLLSWRVFLLPYLDEENLFKKFHLDEPWDSANNKPLIANMPKTFKSPDGKPLADGQTRYVVPFGKGTIFDGNKGIRMEDVLDGLSNTILILEVGADKAVTWTKPDDMDFDPKNPKDGLGTIDPAGIPVALADGSVRTIRKTVDAETFRRLILRNDGMPIDSSKF